MPVYKRARRAGTTGLRASRAQSENQLIEKLTQLIPSEGLTGNGRELRVGIGDDAAILAPASNLEWVISCDASLEGVHFHRKLQPPDSIGYKSLVRASSDLAAMGAQPRYFLLTISLPHSKTGHWLDSLARGMARAARELGMKLIGGDTSRTSDVAIAITVLGQIARGRAALRSGARSGDLIFVTGRLGAAAVGLEIVRRGPASMQRFRKYLQPHFYPHARTALGQLLARRRIPSAMMDLSDGLSTDLARLCAASRVGARIFAAAVPAVKAPSTLLAQGIDPLVFALHGGDDYELLFTVPAKSIPRLRRLSKKFSLACIGEITRQLDVHLIQKDGSDHRLLSRGWDPFR